MTFFTLELYVSNPVLLQCWRFTYPRYTITYQLHKRHDLWLLPNINLPICLYRKWTVFAFDIITWVIRLTLSTFHAKLLSYPNSQNCNIFSWMVDSWASVGLRGTLPLYVLHSLARVCLTPKLWIILLTRNSWMPVRALSERAVIHSALAKTGDILPSGLVPPRLSYSTVVIHEFQSNSCGLLNLRWTAKDNKDNKESMESSILLTQLGMPSWWMLPMNTDVCDAFTSTWYISQIMVYSV